MILTDVCPACQQNMHHKCFDPTDPGCACHMNEHVRPYPQQDVALARLHVEDALAAIAEAAVALGLAAKGCSTHDDPPPESETSDEDPCTPALWPTYPDPYEDEDVEEQPHHSPNPRLN